MTSQLQGNTFNDNVGDAIRAVAQVGDSLGSIASDPVRKLEIIAALGRSAGALLEVYGLMATDDEVLPEPALTVVPALPEVAQPAEAPSTDTSGIVEAEIVQPRNDPTESIRAQLARSLGLPAPTEAGDTATKTEQEGGPDESNTVDGGRTLAGVEDELGVPAVADHSQAEILDEPATSTSDHVDPSASIEISSALEDETDETQNAVDHTPVVAEPAVERSIRHRRASPISEQRAQLWRAFFQNNPGVGFSPSVLGDVIDPEGTMTHGARGQAFATFMKKYGKELDIEHSGATSNLKYGIGILATGSTVDAPVTLVDEEPEGIDTTETPDPVDVRTESGVDDVKVTELDPNEEVLAEEKVTYSLTDWGLRIEYDKDYDQNRRAEVFLGEQPMPLRLTDIAVVATYFLADNPKGLYFGHLKELLESNFGITIPPSRISPLMAIIKNELAVYNQAHQLEITEKRDEVTRRHSTHYKLLGADVQHVSGAFAEADGSAPDEVVYSSTS